MHGIGMGVEFPKFMGTQAGTRTFGKTDLPGQVLWPMRIAVPLSFC
jgi:hypothetical protein